MLASRQATAAYAAAHPELPDNFRILDGLQVSSLGLGTYLGRDNQADSAPGIATALCGCKSLAHARENVELLCTPPLSSQQFARLL